MPWPVNVRTLPIDGPLVGLAIIIAALVVGIIVSDSLRFVFFLLLLGILLYVLPRAIAWRDRLLNPPAVDPRGTPPGQTPDVPSLDSPTERDIAKFDEEYYLWTGGSLTDPRREQKRPTPEEEN